MIQDLKPKGDLIDLAYIKNYNDQKSIDKRQTSEITDSIASLIQDLKSKEDLIDLGYIKINEDPKSIEEKQTS